MKTIIAIMAITGLAVASAFAQMNGGNKIVTGTHQMTATTTGVNSTEVDTPEVKTPAVIAMMGKDTMDDISGSMKKMNERIEQMNERIQQMSDIIEYKTTGMNNTRMKDMSKTMGDMSQTMKEMSGQMAQGKINAAKSMKMHERLETIRKEMEMMAKEKTEDIK